MILFTYHCDFCVIDFEELIKDDDEKVFCPQCDLANEVHKVVVAPARLDLKGSGWYETDWKNK